MAFYAHRLTDFFKYIFNNIQKYFQFYFDMILTAFSFMDKNDKNFKMIDLKIGLKMFSLPVPCCWSMKIVFRLQVCTPSPPRPRESILNWRVQTTPTQSNPWVPVLQKAFHWDRKFLHFDCCPNCCPKRKLALLAVLEGG